MTRSRPSPCTGTRTCPRCWCLWRRPGNSTTWRPCLPGPEEACPLARTPPRSPSVSCPGSYSCGWRSWCHLWKNKGVGINKISFKSVLSSSLQTLCCSWWLFPWVIKSVYLLSILSLALFFIFILVSPFLPLIISHPLCTVLAFSLSAVFTSIS